jgi:hypothetical protein
VRRILVQLCKMNGQAGEMAEVEHAMLSPSSAGSMSKSLGIGFWADTNGKHANWQSLWQPSTWKDVFDYFWLQAEPNAMIKAVDRDGAARRIQNALFVIDIDDLVPMVSMPTGEPRTIHKVDRQGEFDNVHIAPRMDKPSFIYVDNTSLNDIVMAPVCAHDCLHMHWRWGKALSDLRQNCGWGNGKPYADPGAPMVPETQSVWIKVLNDHGFRYLAEDRAPPAGKWSVIMHHGAAYALQTNWVAGAGRAAVWARTHLLDAEQNWPGEILPSTNPSGEGADVYLPTWPMFYWHMRHVLKRIPSSEKTHYLVFERLNFNLSKARELE